MPRKNNIQFRKGTYSEWDAQATGVLNSGEPGYISDFNKLKVGDGSTQWSDLTAINDNLTTMVINKTANTIPKMSVVYINGAQGDLPSITLSIASGESSSSKTYGLTVAAIAPNAVGQVVVDGALKNLDTLTQFNGVTPGTTLWLSPTISGGITTSKPYAPYHSVSLGNLIRVHQNQGIINVKIQNGFELEELHNVAISGVTDGQFLQYNSGSGLWVPTSSGNFTSLSVNNTGVSLSGHTHSSSNITDFNSSVSGLLTPYQLVLTNPVTGTGVANHIPYWSSTSGLLADSNQLVWDATNNRLGVGVPVPQAGFALDVGGSTVIRGSILLNGSVTEFPNSRYQLHNGASSNQVSYVCNGGGRFGVGFTAPSGLVAISGGVAIGSNYNLTPPTNGLIVEGNVGIGTASPLTRLQVNGSFSCGTSDILGANSNPSIGEQGLYIDPEIPLLRFNDSWPSTVADIDLNGLTLYDFTGNAFFYTDRFNARIGIGTTTPSSTLHVVGDTNIDGNLTFDSFTESVVSNGNSGTSKTLSLASGTVHTCTLTGNCTFTMPTATAGKSFTMFLNTGVGNYTASFSGVRWADSASPTVTILANKVDIYSFISDGSYWYGSFSQNYG